MQIAACSQSEVSQPTTIGQQTANALQSARAVTAQPPPAKGFLRGSRTNSCSLFQQDLFGCGQDLPGWVVIPVLLRFYTPFIILS